MTMEIVRKTTDDGDPAAYTAQLKGILGKTTALKEKRVHLREQRQSNAQAVQQVETVAAAMEQVSAEITEWDESLIRQLVDTVKVLSAEKILVSLRGCIQIEQDMI